jgi:putative membrane protein
VPTARVAGPQPCLCSSARSSSTRRRRTRLAGLGRQPSLWSSWTFEPLELALLVLVIAAVWRLGARRPAAAALGIALLVVALLSPVAAVGDEQLLGFHLAQHVVLWDLAPLSLLVGVGRLPLGRARVLGNPAVALPVWLASLAVWHVPVVLDASVRHGWLHGIQHAALLAAGLLMWAPMLDAVPGPRWFGVGPRFGYVAVMQLAGLAFGNVLLWSGTVLYPAYAGGRGLTAHADQRIAGGVVLLEGSLVAVGVFAWLFLRLMREDG